jgi:flagellar hook-basal body complex protein FliE
LSFAISAISGGLPVEAAVPKINAAPATGGDDFSSFLMNMAQGTVHSIQNGETTAISAIQGKTSIQSAVVATMEAEQSLQAALAIRDKIVSAFLEISRMQI